MDEVFVTALHTVQHTADAKQLSDTPWTVPSSTGDKVLLQPHGDSKFLTVRVLNNCGG